MKTSRVTTLAGLLSLTAYAAVGCERRSDTPKEAERVPSEVKPQDQPTTPGEPRGFPEPSRADHPTVTSPRQGNATAVASITEARCDRETRCNNVGAGKKFETRAACMEKTRNDWRDDLNGLECPRGVKQQELSNCLKQIRDESCANPFDRLGSTIACLASDLCQSTSS